MFNKKKKGFKMKKIYMTIVAMFIAVAASAQVYVGGNVGIASTDDGGDDDVTTYKFLPEIGYNINNEWAIGASFGWAKGALTLEEASSSARTFEVNPYVRYTFVKGKLVDVFCDGGFGYKHYDADKAEADKWSVGFKPGVALKLDKFSLVAHVGFIGWEQLKAKHTDDKVTTWGVSFNSTNLSLGLLYNF